METKLRKLWCSPHQPTKEQGANYILLKDVNPELFQKLINSPDNRDELEKLAEKLIVFAEKNNYEIYQPAGSPAFQFVLGYLSYPTQIKFNYAHTERESEDVPQEDGTIKKISIFRHKKFIEL